MHHFYINQVSISFFTQLLLLGIIIFYLLSFKKKTITTWLILGVLAGMFGIISKDFLVTAMPWHSLLRFHIRPIVYIALYLGMIALLQFIYRFPDTTPEWPRETNIILRLSAFIMCTGLGIWVWQYSRVIAHLDANLGNIELIIELSILLELLWAISVLVRRAICSSRPEADTLPNTKLRMLSSILQPENRKIRGIQRFIVYFGGLVLLLVVSILLECGSISQQTYNILYSTGLLLAIFFLAIIFLNYASREFSFLAKLVGISLVTMLVLLGLIGWMLAPSFEQAYFSGRFDPHTDFPVERRILRFEPNQQGGYTMRNVPFHFDREIGTDLQLTDGERRTVPLDFLFPFYGQTWNEVHVSDDGLVTFGSRTGLSNIWIGLRPSILPLLFDFHPELGGGVFTKTGTETLTITWSQLRQNAEMSPTTTQLVLQADGSFHMSYATLAPTALYKAICGILPGDLSLPLQRTELTGTRPVYGTVGHGLVKDYSTDFRHYMHKQMSPLISVILVTTFIILLGFPIFFKISLVKPLNELVKGVKQVNTGNIAVKIPVRYNDEIGFLTQAFNGMTVQLQATINRLQDLNVELARAKENAEFANLAKTNFLCSVSHELRTPLNHILGFTQILAYQRAGSLNQKQIEYVNTISQSGKHLLSLIEDVLNLSQIDFGKMELSASEVNLKSLLENSLTMIREKDLKESLSLTLRIPEELEETTILADERKLKQIMFNLLSNAVKFTPDDGTIVVAVEQKGDNLIISVTDNGIGIAADDQEKIFENFYQVRGGICAKTPGTGLGLPIARRLVELHGGKLWVHSNGEGKGSRFSFSLPT